VIKLNAMNRDARKNPIGIFDSGVGGLSVLKAVHKELPHENLIYLADQAHVPYGSRSLDDVRNLSEAVTRFLLDQGAKVIVVACNTASAASLRFLRNKYSTIPFVGMEPAVKPAAETTHTGKVGVLATPATFQGELYTSVVERFAKGVELYQHTCPGLVSQIEAGRLNTGKTKRILKVALQPMLSAGIDTVVLGCTHYPFVMPLIQKLVGKEVRVIDPAPAIARQVQRVILKQELLNEQNEIGTIEYFTTGSAEKFMRILPKLVDGLGSVKKVDINQHSPNNA
jgi:glutamate racemase